MIVLLNYTHQDIGAAAKLLRWCKRIGCGLAHDLVLQCSQRVRNEGTFQEIEALGKEAFASAFTASVARDDDRGWPYGPNAAWTSAVWLASSNFGKATPKESQVQMQPFLWMETDVVPLTADCFDRWQKEYASAKKPFMGAEVFRPSRRMTGVGMYPPNTLNFLRKRTLPHLHNRNEAFDSFFAPQIVPEAHFTPLLQNIYFASRNPDTLPTFPTLESLSILSPEAVLFHRCKDGSLIDRLEEKLDGKTVTPTPPVVETIQPQSITRHNPKIFTMEVGKPQRKSGKRMKRRPMTAQREAQLIASLAKAREAKARKAVAA